MFSRKNAIHSHAERFSTLSGSYVRREKAKYKQTAVTENADSLDPIFWLEMKNWLLIFHLES